jgi:hypothetical protein
LDSQTKKPAQCAGFEFWPVSDGEEAGKPGFRSLKQAILVQPKLINAPTSPTGSQKD